jgi:hypothetical protein
MTPSIRQLPSKNSAARSELRSFEVLKGPPRNASKLWGTWGLIFREIRQLAAREQEAGEFKTRHPPSAIGNRTTPQQLGRFGKNKGFSQAELGLFGRERKLFGRERRNSKLDRVEKAIGL